MFFSPNAFKIIQNIALDTFGKQHSKSIPNTVFEIPYSEYSTS